MQTENDLNSVPNAVIWKRQNMSMKKTEIFLIAAGLISVFLNLYMLRISLVPLVWTFVALTMFYGYFSFALFNDITFKEISKKQYLTDRNQKYIRLGRINGKAIAVMVIGLLFTLMAWPWATIFLCAGILGLIVMSVRLYLNYSATKNPFYKSILIRTVLWAAAGLVLFVEKEDMMLFKYREYPAFISVYQQSLRNSDSEVLQEQVDIERRKIYTKK